MKLSNNLLWKTFAFSFFKVTIINNYIHIILRDKSQTKNEYEPVDRTRKAINWLLAAFTVGSYEDLRILKFAMTLIIIINGQHGLIMMYGAWLLQMFSGATKRLI